MFLPTFAYFWLVENILSFCL